MNPKEITLTYLNIRQSITILLAKLFFVDFLTAVLVVFSYYSIVKGGEITNYKTEYTPIFLLIFATLGILKIAADIYVVLQWLFEYYEITPTFISHKKGVIFRAEEKYQLNNVREIAISDSLLGEIFNFGTITVYDLRRQKYFDMYLIHNPQRYAEVLSKLKPNIELKNEETVLVQFRKGWNFGKI